MFGKMYTKWRFYDIRDEMDIKRRRTPGIVTVKFDKEFSEEEVNDFFKEWKGYAIACSLRVAVERCKRDRHIILSSALEGLLEAFFCIKERLKREPVGLSFKKKVIGICVRQCTYHQMVYFGFIPDKKRVFFPKKWVKWEEAFKDSTYADAGHSNYDFNELLKTPYFAPEEKVILELTAQEKCPTEIGKAKKCSSRAIYMTLDAMYGRLKNRMV